MAATKTLGTLSERIGALADAAVELHKEIKQLRKEVDRRDGIEAIEHLADVPGELRDAEDLMEKAYDFLYSAEVCATKGGD